jgi:hypothetical protein
VKTNFLKMAMVAAIPLYGCGESVDVTEFQGYGAGHPGAGKVHGGQLFLELIHTPAGDVGMLHSWARDFTTPPASVASTLPIPLIPSGTCMDITTSGFNIFPRVHIPESHFLDLGPQLSISTGTVTHTANQTMNFVDNLQYKIPLGYQLNPPPGMTGTGVFDASTIQHDATYTVSFNGSENLHPNTMYMSPTYEIYQPAELGKAPLTFTRGQPLEMSWQPNNQDAGGTEHTADRTFAFVIFLGPATPGMPQFKVFCPINDGLGHDSFTVPAEVIDSLPPMGLMVSGQQTHMMAEFQDRRFDLITIECNRSPFSFAQ